MSIFKKALPKKQSFYILLIQLAEKINEATELLHNLLSDKEILLENASKIHILENDCDEIAHSIINKLNETFVTPLDKEDIYQLTNALDDVIDSIDSIARRMCVYKLKKSTVFGPQLSGILLSQTRLIVEIVKSLEKGEQTLTKIIAIKNLETEGDSVFKDALTLLFEKQKDVIELIKEKEILEITEKAVDRCQRVATVMEGILIKNG